MVDMVMAAVAFLLPFFRRDIVARRNATFAVIFNVVVMVRRIVATLRQAYGLQVVVMRGQRGRQQRESNESYATSELHDRRKNSKTSRNVQTLP
jgi:hypothetical protein